MWNEAPGKIGTTLCKGTEQQYQGGTGAQVERGVFHCLTDGDFAIRMPHYCFPCKKRQTRERLDAWKVGQNQMMFKETDHICEQFLSTASHENSEDHQAKTFHSLVLQRKFLTVVRWIMEREKGSGIQPGNSCSDTGKPILDMIWSEHL